MEISVYARVAYKEKTEPLTFYGWNQLFCDN